MAPARRGLLGRAVAVGGLAAHVVRAEASLLARRLALLVKLAPAHELAVRARRLLHGHVLLLLPLLLFFVRF